MPQITDTSTMIIWRFTDGKIGHEKQSQALVASLKELRIIECIDIAISYSSLYYLFHWLFKLEIKSYSAHKSPSLIIGVGHRTHLALLAAQRYYRCKSIVIMSPSLAHQLFTVIVAPQHDYFDKTPPPNAVITPTALSPKIKSEANAERGLILLGGESSHYYWNDDAIVLAVKRVLQTNSNKTIWQLTTSRRTPNSTVELIRRACAEEPRLEILQHQDLSKDWLSDALRTAGNIYVTPDSVSMISEALMTDAAVSLIELRPKNKNGKISKANCYLAEAGFLNDEHNIKSTNRKKINTQNITKKIFALLEL
jgi:mitochondrial fission protein ELM1